MTHPQVRERTCTPVFFKHMFFSFGLFTLVTNEGSFYRNGGRMGLVCFTGKHIRMSPELSQLPYDCLLSFV